MIKDLPSSKEKTMCFIYVHIYSYIYIAIYIIYVDSCGFGCVCVYT